MDIMDIMDIIVRYEVDYSTNLNGLFINLSLVDDPIIDIIYNKLIELRKNSMMKNKPNINTECDEPNKEDINSSDINKTIIEQTINLTKVDKLLLSLSAQTLTI